MSVKTLARAFLVLAVVVMPTVSAMADDEFDAFRKAAIDDFEAFKQQAQNEFEQFRREANEQFARFMSEPWKPIVLNPSTTPPVEPEPNPIYENPDTVHPAAPRPIVIRERISLPKPQPRPKPFEPIKEIPVAPSPQPIPELEKSLKVEMYGTEFLFRHPDLQGWHIHGTRPSDFANAWSRLNTDATNNLIIDCLAERDSKALCDWAYLTLLQRVSEQICGHKGNDTTMLAGFLYCQSGYKMRFAKDSSGTLRLLICPLGIMYGRKLVIIDEDRFYVANEENMPEGGFEICNFSFPKEKAFSLGIDKPLKLAVKATPTRCVTAKYHPEVHAEVAVNQNLIDFYNDYPEGTLDQNFYTKWAIYANVPASEEIKNDLYPVLREAIKDKSQIDAANILIHLAESFPYGYDSKIWGRDRAFFTDESWYYPFSDCEDHAIHFTRLVRDILGLEAVLVYYPGHLAAAIAFDDEVVGDYIEHRGKRFTVCDPSIFYSNVGTTMRGMNNEEAILIDLE